MGGHAQSKFITSEGEQKPHGWVFWEEKKKQQKKNTEELRANWLQTDEKTGRDVYILIAMWNVPRTGQEWFGVSSNW